ncbi:MAG TPA: AraC family transcriptional regulator [Clostridiales bacterium]|nr:AraC family transcriptional regulator [Clostridiales bacterium]
MDWLNRMNQAVDYIEDNLSEEISFGHAARIACCSVFHFQRMFAYIAGVPLSEYIRRRRMTAAAFELQTTDEKIIDLALKYGYDSPTAFNRAFRSIHGVSPSAARREGAALAAFPRISFTISIKGEEQMNYKIVTKEAFRIVGTKIHLDMKMEECFEKVPQFWQKTIQSGIVPQILSLLDQSPLGLLGVSTCMDGEALDYYIAVSSGKEVPDNMEDYLVPAGTWAIFECIGAMPGAIQELQKRIVTEWLPTSGYEYSNGPDIEVYFEGDQKSPAYRSEVWLPIVKK